MAFLLFFLKCEHKTLGELILLSEFGADLTKMIKFDL